MSYDCLNLKWKKQGQGGLLILVICAAVIQEYGIGIGPQCS